MYQDAASKQSRIDATEGSNQVETLNRYDLGWSYTITKSYCQSHKIGNEMADLFYPWLLHATWSGTEVIRGVKCNEYTLLVDNTGLYTCLEASNNKIPIVLNINHNGQQTNYQFSNFREGRPSSSYFSIPSICLKK